MKEFIQKKIQVLENQLVLTESSIYQLKERRIGLQNQLQPLKEVLNEIELAEKLEKQKVDEDKKKKREAARRLKKHETK